MAGRCDAQRRQGVALQCGAGALRSPSNAAPRQGSEGPRIGRVVYRIGRAERRVGRARCGGEKHGQSRVVQCIGKEKRGQCIAGDLHRRAKDLHSDASARCCIEQPQQGYASPGRGMAQMCAGMGRHRKGRAPIRFALARHSEAERGKSFASPWQSPEEHRQGNAQHGAVNVSRQVSGGRMSWGKSKGARLTPRWVDREMGLGRQCKAANCELWWGVTTEDIRFSMRVSRMKRIAKGLAQKEEA